MAILFSVEPLDPVSGNRVTLRFCNADDARLTNLDDEKWWPGIARAPALNREGWNYNFDGAISLAQASIDIQMLALRKHDPASPTYRWAGAPVNIWRGEAGDAWASFELLFSGLGTNYELKESGLALTCKVDSEPFEADLMSLKYAGTGDVEGPEDLKEKTKPLALGRCLNVEPVLINDVDNVYQVSAYGPIEGIPMAFERAAEFGASLGDHANYAALVAATVPEGQWATCLAEGLFRLGAPAAGLITADVDGDNTNGFVQTTAAIIERLCDIASVDPSRIDSASLAAFETACPYPINVYLTSAEKLIDAIQRLVMPCNAQAALSWTGLLQVTRFTGVGTPTMTLDAQGRSLPPVLSCEELNVSPPWTRIEMQANKNWRVQSKDEIATLDEANAAGRFRRYPTLPATPEGDEPEDWTLDPPTFAVGSADGDHLSFGPVWSSFRQEDGTWSTPVLQDARYKGWSLTTTSTDAKAEGATDSIRANGSPAGYLFYYIEQPIHGPCILRCRVRGAADRVGMGVCTYDPTIFNADTGNVGDFEMGFYVAQNDDYEVATPANAPVTGVFPSVYFGFSDAGYTTPVDTKLADPAASLLLELIYNGETFEYYVNGVLGRSFYYDKAEGEDFWPVFVLRSDDAEIYDIEWFRGTAAQSLGMPKISYMMGPLRRRSDGKGLEAYMPFDTGSSDGGLVYFGRFDGGAEISIEVEDPSKYLTARIEGAGRMTIDSGNVLFYSGDAGFGLGTLRSTTAIIAGQRTVLNYRAKRIRGFKNGLRRMKKKVGRGIDGLLYIEIGPDSSMSGVDIVGQVDEDDVIKGTATAPPFTTPVTDATATVDVSGTMYSELARATIAFNPGSDDEDDLAVSATLSYTNSGGSAVNFTPATLIQYSVDGGGTWATWSSTQVPSSATAATPGGAAQSLSNSGTEDSWAISGTHIFRFLVRNTVVGVFSAAVSGTLSAEWQG